jgi:hypothetical protein
LQEDEGKQFDDDYSRRKSLRTNLIQKDFVELNASALIFWKFVLIFVCLVMNLVENWCEFESLLRWFMILLWWLYDSVTVVIFCYGG